MLRSPGERQRSRTVNGQPDRVAGVLLGLATGDRNGGPIQMALCLAESLDQRSCFDLDDVWSRYRGWWQSGASDTGPIFARVMTLADAGLTRRQAALQVHAETGQQTAGCNPAHRCAPLAMLPGLDSKEVARSAEQEAQLTHRHPLAGDAAAAVATLCSELIRGMDWDAALEVAAQGRLHEVQAALATNNGAALNRGGYAPDVLAAAVYLVGSSGSLTAALERAVRFAGPANYAPVLVGSLGGARWGASSITAQQLQH